MPSSGRNTRDPIQQFRLALRNSPILGSESKAHVMLWLDDIEAMTPQDQRQRAMVRSALVAYASLTRIGDDLLSLAPSNPKVDRLTAQYGRMTELLAKSLRLAGLRRGAGNGNGKSKQGAIFTPARQFGPLQVTPIVTSDGDIGTTDTTTATDLE